MDYVLTRVTWCALRAALGYRNLKIAWVVLATRVKWVINVFTRVNSFSVLYVCVWEKGWLS